MSPDSRRERALTAARIRLRSPVPRPLLDETRIDEVCAELLAVESLRWQTLNLLEAAIMRAYSRGTRGDPERAVLARVYEEVRTAGLATSPETALPATIDTMGGSGHG